jgi:iron complex transport system ATP-binding protein
MIVMQMRGVDVVIADRVLVRALDWDIRRDEFWCVLGKNGAGKTTLLQVMAGIRQPRQGQLYLCGDPLHTTPLGLLAQRRGLMQQQQVDAFAHGVFDAVAIACFPSNALLGFTTSSVEALVSKALARVGMAGSEGRNVLALSGGERQRVALAALLVQAPDLMLLDEPVSHQDMAQQLQVMQLLRERSAQHAVIASCHDINLAKRFATHALVLGDADADGKHWIGSASEILVPAILSDAFGCEFVEQGDWLVPC